MQRRSTVLTLVGILISGCVSQPSVESGPTEDLLSGQELFGEVVDISDLSAEHVLALDDGMREYVARRVGNNPQARARLRALVTAMIEDGLLTLDYDPNLTYTATETFYKRQGNCLSFSMLFAALAREARLNLTFQMVEIPPSFRADGELVLLNNHINVLVQGVRRDATYTGDYVVDFNTAEYNGNYETRKVDDNYAIALYFSNVAVEALRAGGLKRAFRFLKKGIETDPDIAGLWVNLGVIYARNDRFDLAARAYQEALSLQPSHKSALVNMASALHRLGRIEEAGIYAKRVEYYRDHHPYYHHHLAHTAFRENRLDAALQHLAEAIRLKDDEHQFYFLRGLIHKQQGALDLAARDFGLAREVAEDTRLVSGYARKLEALEPDLR